MRKLFMSPVDSSQLRSAGYDEEESDLYVEFKTSTVYRYSDVPQTIFEKLKNSESPGSYFSGNIKGVYEFKRLETLVDKEHNLQIRN